VPQPDVDSAFVRITPRSANELPEYDTETFTKLVRLGFAQRRKQLQKLLREEVPDWETTAATCSFDPKARAEELSLLQWIALSNLTAGKSNERAQTEFQEQFAVVDANDRVVGSAPRSEVHANNLLHRAVHILVFNRCGELFLQKRSRWKDRHPLLWDSSAAGHVNAGEDYDPAARRELREELGSDADLKRIAKLPASVRTGLEFICVYKGVHDGPFTLAPKEIEFGEFFPPDVISGWIAARPGDFAPGFLECWKAFLRREAQSSLG
jgi:16S rRNA (adenine1518-N6/adenine1519-N6)-dimethyltransferase